MARYELFRTALTEPGMGDNPHRLILAHETRDSTQGYVVGKLYIEGGPLIGVAGAKNLRQALKIFEGTLKRSPWYRPQAQLYAHPTLNGGQWLTIHARDGATVLVSMLASPGQRFWVSQRYVLTSEEPPKEPGLPADLTRAELRAFVSRDAEERQRLIRQLWQRCRADSPLLGRYALANLVAKLISCTSLEVWSAVGQTHFEQARDDAGPSVQQMLEAGSRNPTPST